MKGSLTSTDNDGDQYGSSLSIEACEMPPGYATNGSDCDDSNTFINPSEIEVCDYIDNDCNGVADEGLEQTQYADGDGDGYGDPNIVLETCFIINGYVLDNTDCNDSEPLINPGEPEVCNGIDDDCTGAADDGLVFTDFYVDSDGDGFGEASSGQNLCAQPNGTVTNNTDCDDNNSAINPAEAEVCNGIDDDCSGLADDGQLYRLLQDSDNDGLKLNFVQCMQPTAAQSQTVLVTTIRVHWSAQMPVKCAMALTMTATATSTAMRSMSLPSIRISMATAMEQAPHLSVQSAHRIFTLQYRL